jgi:hypothetical protein
MNILAKASNIARFGVVDRRVHRYLILVGGHHHQLLIENGSRHLLPPPATVNRLDGHEEGGDDQARLGVPLFDARL